ncbi:hypothetical protein JNB62_01430 [Microbacterium jejuense]|uniref:DUF998 domain-containing protein n=1 Tax=Microbacterium jejuense TaxID=1263637 RepID=A0ABS7HHZ0_9MICO|nr:hypothetical protein [Microbacterium jejuense]MBW9092338.1 hypothetical protein [Microbacterium jejuense]
MMSAPRTTAEVSPAVARHLGVWIVLAGGLSALPFGSTALSLVREQLHIGCGMGAPGSEGADTWTCSDGIGYLGIAMTLGGMWLLAVLLGALAAGAVRRDDAARAVLVLVAGASTAWVLGFTWYGSSELVQDEYAPMDGQAYWQAAVGPAAIVAAASIVIAVVGLCVRGRLSQAAHAAAAVGIVVATALQPGLGVNTIPAAALLAAAAVRATGVIRQAGS